MRPASWNNFTSSSSLHHRSDFSSRGHAWNPPHNPSKEDLSWTPFGARGELQVGAGWGSSNVELAYTNFVDRTFRTIRPLAGAFYNLRSES